MPKAIISDRDPRFVSRFWRSFFEQGLGTTLRFSTAYHPQTDGQSERTNRTLEEILRHYVSPQQTDWDEYLDCAEYAINDAQQVSTGYTPFQLAYGGQQPATPIDIAVGAVAAPAAEQRLQQHADLLAHARVCIQQAQARMQQYENSKRRDVRFEMGDLVRLSAANMNLKGVRSRKLGPNFLGPFKVLAQVGEVAYKLELPSTLRIHPVFSQLQPWRRRTPCAYG